MSGPPTLVAAAGSGPGPRALPSAFHGLDAVIFDMDGVVTDTATVHARCWKRTFDAFLRARSERSTQPFVPFTLADYLHYVDGKPRYDGVASFLAARHIDLPRGSASDPPGYESVCALGNLKDQEFEREVAATGARPYPSTVTLIRTLRAHGVGTALITSSRHGRHLVDRSGLTPLFDVLVDGVDADRLHLPGKPDPAIYLQAAELLHVAPARAAVVEDALAGVEAGRRGHFGLVLGVDRGAGRSDLLEHGADLVVSDLAEVEAPAPPEET